jgi:hypothetical protein
MDEGGISSFCDQLLARDTIFDDFIHCTARAGTRFN